MRVKAGKKHTMHSFYREQGDAKKDKFNPKAKSLQGLGRTAFNAERIGDLAQPINK